MVAWPCTSPRCPDTPPDPTCAPHAPTGYYGASVRPWLRCSYGATCAAGSTRLRMEALPLPGSPIAGVEGTEIWTRLSGGAVFRTKPRDRGLIGISNGGTAQSINQDDGNRNFDPGLVLGGLRGQTEFRFRRDVVEGRLNAVYYTNFTEDRGVVPKRGPFARSFGTNGYLNEAYLGVVGRALGAEARLRVGNQILRWGGTSFLNFGLNVPNPYQFARIYLPGAGLEDGYKALPMLVGRLEWDSGAAAEAFWKFDFAPDLGSPNGWLGSTNDAYTPGSRALFLSPFVPDADVSIVTPNTSPTQFGSRVPRAADRVGDSLGQVGLRLRSPDLFGGTTNLWLYAATFTDPEGVASSRTGTATDLLGITAPNYAAGSRYFVDYKSGVGLIGAAADVQPAPFTLLRVEYALRLAQPLQVRTDETIRAGLAPAAVASACGGGRQASPVCATTLQTFNANQLIRRAGGITATNFGRFFGTEIGAGSRHNVSQVVAELTQGIGRPFGSDGLGLLAGFGGMYVHNYDPDALALDSQISPATPRASPPRPAGPGATGSVAAPPGAACPGWSGCRRRSPFCTTWGASPPTRCSSSRRGRSGCASRSTPRSAAASRPASSGRCSSTAMASATCSGTATTPSPHCRGDFDAGRYGPDGEIQHVQYQQP